MKYLVSLLIAMSFLFIACDEEGYGEGVVVDEIDFIDAQESFFNKDSSYWLSYKSDSNHVTIEEWITDGSGFAQGFDAFGHYLLGLAVGMREYKVSDLRNKKYIGMFFTGFGLEQARHANCQNFTSTYYMLDDPVPLLLVSGSESTKDIDLKGVAYLVRIKVKDGRFHLELVQTITTVPGTYKDSDGHDYPFGGYSNIMVDRETGHFYVINGSNIYEMEQPSLFDEIGNVVSESYLTVDNVIRRIGFKYKTRYPQGASINNGLAYIASGTGDSYLQIVDLSSGKELNSIHLSDIGFNLEPEDVAFWQNSMILSGGSTRGVYRVYWE